MERIRLRGILPVGGILIVTGGRLMIVFMLSLVRWGYDGGCVSVWRSCLWFCLLCTPACMLGFDDALDSDILNLSSFQVDP